MKRLSNRAKRVSCALISTSLAVSLCPLMPLTNEAQAQEVEFSDSSPQATASKYPIASWTKAGTCEWMIDENGLLTVRPQSGLESGVLESNLSATGSNSPWNSYRDKITSAVIEPGVICKYPYELFKYCSNMKEVDLSGLDISEATGLSGIFYGCESLQSINLSGLDTSEVTSMYEMFYGCKSLQSVTLSDIDTSEVTTMREMFKGCSSLQSVDLSRIDTSEVTDMSYMFSGCTALKTFSFPDVRTPRVKDMSYMFQICKSLSSFDFSQLDTSNVVNMQGMFDCSGNPKETLYLSNLDTSNVRNMNSMFYSCNAKTIDVSNLDISNASTMKSMFRGTEARTIKLPKTQPEKLTDATMMFADNKKLRALDLSNFTAPQLKTMDGMFSGMTELESIDLTGLGTTIVESMKELFKDCSSLKTITFGSFNTSQLKNASYAFSGCSSLVTLDLSSLTKNHVESKYTFSGCSSLEKLTLNNSSWCSSYYGKGLAECSSLSVIKLETGGITSGYYPDAPIYVPYTGKWVNIETGDTYEAKSETLKGPGTFTWEKKLPDNFVTVNQDDEIYSGEPITKQIDSNLKEGVDYEVEYLDNVNVGTATIKVKGIGCYAGQTQSFSFRILQADPAFEAPSGLAATYGQALADVALPGGFSWQEDASTPVGAVGDSGFHVCFTPADARNYKTVRDIPVTVSVSPAKVETPALKDMTFDGTEQTIPLPSSDLFTASGDFSGRNVGLYDVVFSLNDKSSYVWGSTESSADITVSYAITPADTSNVDVEPIPQQKWTGSEITPKPTLKIAESTLQEGIDYMLDYENNINNGTGIVIVRSTGNISGDIEVPFKIVKSEEPLPVPVFTDVDYSSWYGNAVTFVAEKGLITGYTDGVKAGQFGVGDPLTRAQLATILWRNACPDEYASYDPDTAVDATGIDGSADGMYYTAAANWAVRNGVITGFEQPDGTFDFAADDNVSFEQLITILSRLCATDAELSAAGSDLSAFADGDLASSWSRGAFAWAAANGLVQGYDEPTGKYLRPGEPVARERVAVVLMRAFEMDILK